MVIVIMGKKKKKKTCSCCFAFVAVGHEKGWWGGHMCFYISLFFALPVVGGNSVLDVASDCGDIAATAKKGWTCGEEKTLPNSPKSNIMLEGRLFKENNLCSLFNTDMWNWGYLLREKSILIIFWMNSYFLASSFAPCDRGGGWERAFVR